MRQRVFLAAALVLAFAAPLASAADLPPIIVQLAVIAMLNRDVYQSLAPFADEIIELDGALSSAMIGEERRAGSQGEALRRCYATAVDLEMGFRHGVADLFPNDAHWSSSEAE